MRPLIIFDLDGTLVDSHRDIAFATNRTLEALGYAARSPDALRQMIGHGVRHLLGRALETEDEALIEAGRQHFYGFYRDHLMVETCLFDGMRAAIEDLLRAEFSLLIATNKPAAFTAPILAQLELHPTPFAAYACGDEAPKKPSPAIVELAMQRGGYETDRPIIYVGDTDVDVETSRNIGCPSIGVLWGFGRQGLVDAKPDALLAHPSELPAAVAALAAPAAP